MFVRWLGAFRKGASSLNESLTYELGRDETDEVACEPLLKKESEIRQARIGLVVSRQAIISKFTGDVWSEIEDGKLKPSRKPCKEGHGEAFAHPVYTGIVIDLNGGLYYPAKRIVKTLCWISDTYGLPVYWLKKGQTKEAKF